MILAAAGAEQFDGVALVDAEFCGGTVQVEDELVHAHASRHAIQSRTVGGHHAHRAAVLQHVLGAFHIESGGGAVDAVRITERHDRGGGIGRSQIGAAVGDAMAGLDVLHRAELRLQRHGRFQAVGGRRAHGRIGLVPVQADARARQLEVDLRAGQRRRGVGEVPDLRRDAGRFHTAGEVLEVLDLPVGGIHEFRHVRSVGHGEVAPLADDAQHAFLGERHQLGERRVESGRRESIAPETGIDLHMHACGLAEPAGRGGHAVDAGERADGDVDVVVDQFVERHARAVVHPCQNVAAVRSDAGLAQQ